MINPCRGKDYLTQDVITKVVNRFEEGYSLSSLGRFIHDLTGNSICNQTIKKILTVNGVNTERVKSRIGIKPIERNGKYAQIYK